MSNPYRTADTPETIPAQNSSKFPLDIEASEAVYVKLGPSLVRRQLPVRCGGRTQECIGHCPAHFTRRLVLSPRETQRARPYALLKYGRSALRMSSDTVTPSVCTRRT